ncbi:MAG TPA: hypothetical protein VFR10_04610 [bacterium]|nr:hypothetical protein [bacterium]
MIELSVEVVVGGDSFSQSNTVHCGNRIDEESPGTATGLCSKGNGTTFGGIGALRIADEVEDLLLHPVEPSAIRRFVELLVTSRDKQEAEKNQKILNVCGDLFQ